MSKEAAQRAMREARYAERQKAGSGERRPAAPVRPAAAAAPTKKTAPTSTATPAEPASGELCGHRSMNGRTCTREQGHAAKNHRYS